MSSDKVSQLFAKNRKVDKPEKVKAPVVDVLQDNTRTYMAGYLSRSLMNGRHWVRECKKCRKDLQHLVAKYGLWKGFKYVNPSVRILQVYNDCYDRAVTVLPLIATENRIGRVLASWLEEVVPREKFYCQTHDLQQLYIQRFSTFIVRIWVQNINDVLTGSSSIANDAIKQIARKHYLAARKRKLKTDRWKQLQK